MIFGGYPNEFLLYDAMTNAKLFKMDGWFFFYFTAMVVVSTTLGDDDSGRTIVGYTGIFLEKTKFSFQAEALALELATNFILTVCS